MGLAMRTGWVAAISPQQIPGVAHVVVEGVAAHRVAGNQGLDDAADTRLGEAGEQRVEVGGAGEDEALFGLVDGLRGDGLRGGDVHLVHDFPGERVDEPRLSGGELEDAGDRLVREELPGLVGVLGVQAAHLLQ